MRAIPTLKISISGVRGVVGDSLTPELVARFAQAFGTWVGGGRVVITAQSAETGDNVGEIDATVEGDPIEIAFNARFLADVLGVLNSPQVALETLGAASPGVLKPVGREDFTHVIMPMHIGK